jgi:hypothetical protein
MSTRTRIRLYKGTSEAEAAARSRDDAIWAAREGWHPAEWRWDGTAMRVVYVLREPGPRVEPSGRRTEQRRLRRQLQQLTGRRRVRA